MLQVSDSISDLGHLVNVGSIPRTASTDKQQLRKSTAIDKAEKGDNAS